MIDLDIARKDELPQTFTSQDIEDIKAEIDIPRANVKIESVQIYSPVERQIGYWQEYRTVDGQQVLMQKPVYQKMIIAKGVNGSNQAVTFPHGILNTERRVVVATQCDLNYSNFIVPTTSSIDMSHNQQYDVSIINSDSTYMYMSLGASRANVDVYVVLQYTLTTDEWEVVE